MINLDDVKCTLAEAANFAQLKSATAYSWIKQEWLRLDRKSDQRAETAGATTYISGRRVVQLTIAARLVAAGIHPGVACRAGRHFTDMSDPNEAPGFEREPGELFSDAARRSNLKDRPYTSLVVYGDGSCAVVRHGTGQAQVRKLRAILSNGLRGDAHDALEKALAMLAERGNTPAYFEQAHFPNGGLTQQNRYEIAVTVMLDFIVKRVVTSLEAHTAIKDGD